MTTALVGNNGTDHLLPIKKMTRNGRAVLRIHIFKVPYLLPIKGRGD